MNQQFVFVHFHTSVCCTGLIVSNLHVQMFVRRYMTYTVFVRCKQFLQPHTHAHTYNITNRRRWPIMKILLFQLPQTEQNLVLKMCI